EGNPTIDVLSHRTETLYTTNAVHVFNRKTRTVYSETVKAGFPVLAEDPAFAWFEARDTDSLWTARQGRSRVILTKSVDAGYGAFNERMFTTYRIRLDSSGIPASAVMTVSRRSTGRVNVTAWKRFVYRNVGSHVRFDLPPELRAKLDQDRYS
ncbi:MAG: hypothetical protein Q8N15_02485, partial [Bacillota bacterium]|nr:hypothetical protein [Bacillota bacterium]